MAPAAHRPRAPPPAACRAVAAAAAAAPSTIAAARADWRRSKVKQAERALDRACSRAAAQGRDGVRAYASGRA